jgi:predicted transcriptional regulator
MADLLNVIISSEKRKKLLILLQGGLRTWDEIKVQLNVTATGMLPQIKILEEEGLVVRDGKVYSLTDLGRLVVHYLEPFDKTLEVLDRQKKFWQEHDIRALPDEFLLRIGELGNVKVIECGNEEIYMSHSEFPSNIVHSKRVKGIAHIVHPTYPSFFLDLAKKNVDTSLILTKNVFNIVRTKYSTHLSEWLTYPNAHLFVIDEEIKFSTIVTDHYFSISLFYRNGIFDSKRDLVSYDASACVWGEDLFNYYRKRSDMITSLE